MLDGEIIRRGVAERILWQPAAIAAYVGSAQMQNMHVESLDAPDLSFDIGNAGHVWGQV